MVLWWVLYGLGGCFTGSPLLDNANSPIAAWNLYEVCAQRLRHSSARWHGTNCRCLSASAHGSGAGMLGALWGTGASAGSTMAEKARTQAAPTKKHGQRSCPAQPECVARLRFRALDYLDLE